MGNMANHNILGCCANPPPKSGVHPFTMESQHQ